MHERTEIESVEKCRVRDYPSASFMLHLYI